MAAGLHQPSAFRSYLNMVESSVLLIIGKLSDHDWQQIRVLLALAFDLTT